MYKEINYVIDVIILFKFEIIWDDISLKYLKKKDDSNV